jgi:hypothetical protein
MPSPRTVRGEKEPRERRYAISCSSLALQEQNSSTRELKDSRMLQGARRRPLWISLGSIKVFEYLALPFARSTPFRNNQRQVALLLTSHRSLLTSYPPHLTGYSSRSLFSSNSLTIVQRYTDRSVNWRYFVISDWLSTLNP